MRELLALLLLAGAQPLAAQVPAELARERVEFAHWLATDPLSPYAAVGLQPIGRGVSIGVEPADIPLPGVPRGVITEEAGSVALTSGSSRRSLPRLRPTSLGGGYRLLVSGSSGRTLVAVYGAPRRVKSPSFYDYRPDLRFQGRLEAPERRGRFRILGLEGAETEAVEAGLLRLIVSGTEARLRVYRVGPADEEDAPLLIFFRDETNGRGTYPAGRFLELIPAGNGEYQVDFNRARNPFCAYSSVFPCPAPWPGNSVAAIIPAGERYDSDGQDAGASPPDPGSRP